MNKADLERASLDLQRLAFNLADELNTLNFHSMSEAVKQIRHGAAEMGEEMSTQLKRLTHNANLIPGYFPDVDMPGLEEQMEEMARHLEVLRRCTGEAKNFHEFIEDLMGFIELCTEWGNQDPLHAEEGF